MGGLNESSCAVPRTAQSRPGDGADLLTHR